MTQDEILDALHKVVQENKHYTTWTVSTPHLVALVNLAIEQEREVWERRCERLQRLMDIRETQPNKPCCLAEREACAEVCKKHADFYAGLEPSPIAQSAWAACVDNRDTIRARGQA
jgi:hypothetical protein